MFGGSYLGDTINEFPESWFKSKISKSFDVNLNYFKLVWAKLKEWQKKDGSWKKILEGGFSGNAAFQLVEEFEIDRIDNAMESFGPRHIGGIKKTVQKNILVVEKNSVSFATMGI